MRLIVTLEHRFFQTPDGATWSNASLTHRFWERYLDVFEEIVPVARVQQVSTNQPYWKRADGPCVRFHPIPYYVGPWQYLRVARAVRRAVQDAPAPNDALVLRVPSESAHSLFAILKRSSRPYAVEVVGDPWDVFAPGAIEHPLRPLFRRYASRQLRLHCAHACAAAYVTERTLQRRYPPGPNTLSTCYSSVDLPEECFVAQYRRSLRRDRTVRLATVGSLEQLYKAPDVLIEAVARCLGYGLDIELVIVGEGRYRPRLEAEVARRVLADRFRFLGQLPAGEAVRRELDRADLFVLPSKTEGLPRAMIEAMARGLPCIGSTAGGIPELLPPEDMVPPGDAVALAVKIREVITNPRRMREMSARNLSRAKDFSENTLRQRRMGFYRFIQEQTERWVRRREQNTHIQL